MGCEHLARRIIDALFEHSIRSLTDRKRDLIEANGAITGNAEGFLYGGVFHTLLNPRQALQAKKSIIARPLRVQARDLMDSQGLHDREYARALNGLTTVLKACKTLQDARDMLPTTITKLHPDLASLPRTRPVGHLYATTPLSMHQFDLVVDLLELHASNRIL